MMMGLAQAADGRFEGRVYNADNGKYYNVSLLREQTNQLKVRGCLLGVLCGTQTWTQAVDAAPGELVGGTGAPNGPRPDKEWASVTWTMPSTSAAAGPWPS
jgi:hypothetical protein